jgi:hypothetical protein
MAFQIITTQPLVPDMQDSQLTEILMVYQITTKEHMAMAWDMVHTQLTLTRTVFQITTKVHMVMAKDIMAAHSTEKTTTVMEFQDMPIICMAFQPLTPTWTEL